MGLDHFLVYSTYQIDYEQTLGGTKERRLLGPLLPDRPNVIYRGVPS